MLVACPLKSIVEDWITEAQSMGISAASAANVSDAELRKLIFSGRKRDNISRVSLFVYFGFAFSLPASVDWFKNDRCQATRSKGYLWAAVVISRDACRLPFALLRRRPK